MIREILKSKIHRATVTEANLDYIGSITIDKKLMEVADIKPYEKVLVANVSTGQRFTTYAMEGKKDSGVICINGAAAHLAKLGDIVIILTFMHLYNDEVDKFNPKIVLVDENNSIVKS